LIVTIATGHLEPLDDALSTIGDWGTEPLACQAFDQLVADQEHFKVYREVAGRLVAPSWGCDQIGMRIDRVLVPRAPAIEGGWTAGCIGVEIKKSGTKAGPAICQSMDYMRTAFRLPESRVVVMLGACFIWPAPKPFCDIASVMAQHRIGVAYPTRSRRTICFELAARRVLAIGPDVSFGHMDWLESVGRKSGSR
jgi:hypothetical protein